MQGRGENVLAGGTGHTRHGRDVSASTRARSKGGHQPAPARHVWRASGLTLVGVWLFAAIAGVCVPVLAYLVYSVRRDSWVPAVLAGLSVVALAYVWRFGLHPSLRADARGVTVTNPFRRYAFSWSDIAVVAPGGNGLLVASEDAHAEVWCVQKSNFAARRGRRTRADRITTELLDLQDYYDPPLEDVDTGLRIRRARPDESRRLTRMERAASQSQFAHIFPPERYPYPSAEVAKRWRRLLRDPSTRIRVLDLFDAPVGYVAFTDHAVLHLGVVPHQTRQGYGSALLEYATTEIFDRRTPVAYLWVLAENNAARALYASHGWTETGERRECEFAPYPEGIQLAKHNPAAPRRSRST